MIYDDIVRLQKWKQEIEKDSSRIEKLNKKILKVESKYKEIIIRNDNIMEVCYIDKYNNKVVVFKDGEVIQIAGSSINPHFISFLFAYLLLIAISIPLMIISLFDEKLQHIVHSITLIMNPLALILNVFNFVFCWKTLVKHKFILVGVILASILTLTSVISSFH